MAKFVKFFFLILAIPAISWGQPVEITQLIEKIDYYDNKTVTIRGEAIGDKMDRESGVWVNISDVPNSAIGCWVSPRDAAKILHLGDYNHKGDIVEIKGVFHRACPLHMGEIDLHAESMDVIQKGSSIPHPVAKWKIEAAFVLALAAGVLGWIWRGRGKVQNL